MILPSCSFFTTLFVISYAIDLEVENNVPDFTLFIIFLLIHPCVVLFLHYNSCLFIISFSIP